MAERIEPLVRPAAAPYAGQLDSAFPSGMHIVLLVALLALLPLPARAQGVLGVGFGGSRVEGSLHLSMAAFLEGHTQHLYGQVVLDASTRPATHEDAAYWSELPQLGRVCRDTETRAIVDSSKCAEADYGMALVAGIRMPVSAGHLMVGSGFRIGDSRDTVIGHLAYRFPFDPRTLLSVGATVGSGYLRGVVSAAWTIW